MADPSGWSKQSPWLKLMFLASLVLVVVGLYRCSGEITPVRDPGVIMVDRAVVDVPAGMLAAPPESVASIATRQFTRELRAISGAVVLSEETPEVWAIVRLRIDADGQDRLKLTAVASSAVGGGSVGRAEATGVPDSLREMSASTAAEIVRALDIGRGESAENLP